MRTQAHRIDDTDPKRGNVVVRVTGTRHDEPTYQVRQSLPNTQEVPGPGHHTNRVRETGSGFHGPILQSVPTNRLTAPGPIVGSRHRHFKTLKPCCQPFAPEACFGPDASTLKDGDGQSRGTSAPSKSLSELGDSMRNLLCVIGRHEWQTKYDTEGRPFEICRRPGCYHTRGHSSSDRPYTGTDPTPRPPEPDIHEGTHFEDGPSSANPRQRSYVDAGRAQSGGRNLGSS
jgi:hypothetical protein